MYLNESILKIIDPKIYTVIPISTCSANLINRIHSNLPMQTTHIPINIDSINAGQISCSNSTSEYLKYLFT